MPPLLTVDADARAIIQALDALGDVVVPHLKAAAKVTADNVARLARERVRRRTGRTAEGITVEDARVGSGAVVYVQNPEMPNIDIWLEFGTTRMTPKPFLFASARLEEGAHERRILEAVNAAITEVSGS